MKISETKQGDPLWPQVAALFPACVKWLDDPQDDGDYHFLAATDDNGTFLGASVIEIGNLSFGPMSGVPAGYLENIEVLDGHRRKGVGTRLLQAVLDLAWNMGCESVRSTVDYDNTPALALYRAQGLGFVPEEDPSSKEPDMCYTIVAIHPKRIAHGYGRSTITA